MGRWEVWIRVMNDELDDEGLTGVMNEWFDSDYKVSTKSNIFSRTMISAVAKSWDTCVRTPMVCITTAAKRGTSCRWAKGDCEAK